jgi:hypothetical protein
MGRVTNVTNAAAMEGPSMIAAETSVGVISVSRDIARALTGTLKAPVYSVKLHALPAYTIRIEAESVDAAHALAVALVRRERALKQTGATVVREA